MPENNEVTHKGGCHCGKIQFEVRAPGKLHCIRCNCSVCLMKQNIHFIVPVAKFKLLCGEDYLSTYTFNTHAAKHKFCKVCGVQSFYIPRSNPDGVGVMPHCLDKRSIVEVTIEDFNGDTWEESMKTDKGRKVAELSKT